MKKKKKIFKQIKVKEPDQFLNFIIEGEHMGTCVDMARLRTEELKGLQDRIKNYLEYWRKNERTNW